jgi:hypothetical protein
MNEIQGEPPISEMDDDILALLIQVFCSKEIQGEEDEE